ncbi:hypothetical protein, partial [Candidatus Hakubella thermalkaliphila]
MEAYLEGGFVSLQKKQRRNTIADMCSLVLDSMPAATRRNRFMDLLLLGKVNKMSKLKIFKDSDTVILTAIFLLGAVARFFALDFG